MTKNLTPVFNQVKHYPLIILSDIHLGKKSCSADMLYEFLMHHTCDTLVLNGDIIDGWVLEKKRHRKLPEMQKRVIDLINARIASGLRVVYIPGNHDEKLRAEEILGKTIHGIHFSDSLIYTDRLNRRFFILHGDQFDPQFLKNKGSTLYKIGDALYDGLIELNAVTSKAASKLLSKKFSIAAYAKKKTKNLMGLIGRFEDVVTQSANDNDTDGVICGHIHHAEFEKKGNVLYGNSGDWVESCTALLCSDEGEWSVSHWHDDREKFGLRTPPSEADENKFAEYRPQTEKLLRLVQRMWPGKDWGELMEKLNAHSRKGHKHSEKAERLREELKL